MAGHTMVVEEQGKGMTEATQIGSGHYKESGRSDGKQPPPVYSPILH